MVFTLVSSKMHILIRGIIYLSVSSLTCQALNEQFLGGSISFSVQKTYSGNNLACIELVTGWVLGKGPCGSTCSRTNVGQSTKLSREAILRTDPLRFGNFTADYPQQDSNNPSDSDSGAPIIKDLRNIQQSNYSEFVLAVNEKAHWEQELLSFCFELEVNKSHEYFNFDGYSWRNFQIQSNGAYLKWHLQARISALLRNDTNQLNNCPKVLARPFYRVKLHSKTVLKTPTIDADGDFVKCAKSEFMESGDLGNFKAPGVTVNMDCSIEIDTTVAGYTDGVWIGIPISVKDYNTETIMFGSQLYPMALYSLSSTGLQVVVNVIDQLETAKFVNPTFEQNHKFIVYSESTVSFKIYAQIALNTSLDEFVVTGRNMEPYQISSVHKDTRRNDVRYAEFFWAPSMDDIGWHIACFSAVDNTGVESEEQRCCTINVKVSKFRSSSIDQQTGMTFIDIPSPADLIQCPVDATCIIPIFVSSDRTVSKISIEESYSDSTTIGLVSQVHHNGQSMYKADLSFQHPVNGIIRICFQATDASCATSGVFCIQSEMYPVDPCFSSPCQNSGICVANNKTGSYLCQCDIRNEGRYCEHVKNKCKGDPCAHGRCLDLHTRFYCDCRHTGFSGTRCEHNDNDCIKDPCNGHGVCIDGIANFTCGCFNRYTGNNCTTDSCPATPSSPFACPIVGCDPNPCGTHGVCTMGAGCECSLGYTGSNCSSNIGDIRSQVTGLQFVPPTPADRSSIICYRNNYTIASCEVSVFVATNISSPVFATFTRDYQKTASNAAVTKSTVIDGIVNLHVSHLNVTGLLQEDINGHSLCVTASAGDDLKHLCFELKFLTDPSTDTTSNEFQQQHAAVKFISPTPKSGTRFLCRKGATCWVLLYTSDNSNCATGYQQRCYIIGVYGQKDDPCASMPCQNGALCFHDEHDNYKCICKTSYSGQNCEKGPCPRNDCQNGGYCSVNNQSKTCACPAGFCGSKCEEALNGTINGQPISGAAFRGSATYKDVFCKKHIPCSGLVVVVGDGQVSDARTTPLIVPGYMNPRLNLISLETSQLGTNDLAYQIAVTFMSKDTGTFMLCLQTQSTDGVNKDEVCFNVHVLPGIAEPYGYPDRPHFTERSPPAKTLIECSENEQCHFLYHVTSGKGHEHECASIDGEERCFDILVKSESDNVSRGCQTLHCLHDGFCDGHDPITPQCYCAMGYTGPSCNDSLVTAGSPTNALFVDVVVPSEIRCITNATCALYFQVIGESNMQLPDVIFGDVDSSLGVCKPILGGSHNGVYSGVTNITPKESGTFRLCLQSTAGGLTSDEICMRMTVTDQKDATEKTKPYFLSPTLPRDSTVYCEIGNICHIHTRFTEGALFSSPNICPKLEQTTAQPLTNLHIFPPTKAANCTSDVAFMASPNYTSGDSVSICLKLSLPGKQGEERCYEIKVISNVTSQVDHPCKNVVCPERFRCAGNITSGHNCEQCRFEFTGENCSTPVTPKDPSKTNWFCTEADHPSANVDCPNVGNISSGHNGEQCGFEFTGENCSTPVTSTVLSKTNWTNTANTSMCKSIADACFGKSVGNSVMDARVKALEDKVADLQKLVGQGLPSPFSTIDRIPTDCEEIYNNGTRIDGVYTISPDGRRPFFVYCDMTGGGWTLIQKRLDGSVNFYRSWNDYVQGFGDLDGEHWLGLEKIHRLTKEGSQIYFTINMWDGSEKYAHYKVFTVHEAATVYRMNVDAYGYEGSLIEILSYHDNMKFSTFDRDNDASSSNCCVILEGGGWWYNACYKLNVNGVYGKQAQGGIGYDEGGTVPIKTVNIKIKQMNGVC